MAPLSVGRMGVDEDTAPETWACWLDQNGWRLLAHARQLLSCPSDAEDLVQEVVLELWRGISQVKPPDLPLAMRKLRQRAIDHGRSRTSRKQREQGWQNEQLLDAPLPLAHDHGIDQAHVQKALNTLEPMFREIVSLKLWGDLTFDQIADVLAIPRSTAASRYRLALDKLKPLLEPIRS